MFTKRKNARARLDAFGWKLALFCLTLVLALGSAFGQIGAGGTIVGTITDQSGAAVPNAPVVITNAETNTVTHANSNQNGDFTVAGLPVGHYTVSTEVSGFKKAEQTNVPLNVGDRRVIDLHLQVGSTTESISVEADAVQVQSESGEVSDVITGTQVTQLATNGRSIYTLATLVPGASSNMADYQSPTPVGGDSMVSFNGLRVSHNLYMIDGGEDLDRGGSGNISVMPSIESISEFRALTSNYSAEFGLSSGATLTMVFKSGTKDLHGGLWEFLRNNAFDANDPFRKAAGQNNPELRQNIYGFNLAGPVFIPKLYNKEKEKTFFFYNMEWRKIVRGGSVNQTVPPTSAYGGDFGNIANLNALHVPCLNQVSPAVAAQFASAGIDLSTPDPASGACSYNPANNQFAVLRGFPSNRIPSSLLNSNAQALLGAGIFPAPNSGSQFIGGSNQPTNVREEIVRVDHHFNDKLWLFGHWVAESISQTYGTSQWNSDNLPTSSDVFSNPSYSGVVHATYSITPTILNETAFNYNGNRISIVPKGFITRPTGFNQPELFAGNNLNRIPTIQLGGRTGANFDVGSWPWHNKADDYQFRDDLSWTKGNHQLKFGGSWMLYKKIQDLFGTTQGTYNFNGQYTGNDFADFLLGFADSYGELSVQDHGRWDSQSFAAYVQDNWKVTSRLTLNLGLRWDGLPHTYEENDRTSNFYPSRYNPANAAVLTPGGNSIDPSSPSLGSSSNPILNGQLFYLNGIGIEGRNGIPKHLVKDDWALFAPRLGFAYDLTASGKTILRGGFGIMYERIQGNDMYNAAPNPPFSSQANLNNVSLSDPTLSIQSNGHVTAPISVVGLVGLAENDYKNPASYQYSVGLQRQLGANSTLSLAYVGNQNRHQNDYRNINLPSTGVLAALENGSVNYNTVVPYRGFGQIVMAENAENSNYNGLQVEYRGQLRRDLTLQLAYTWSRALDPATGNGGAGDLQRVSNPYNRGYDWGPSGLDRNQIATLNFVYELPLYRHTSNAFVRTLAGGWELSGVGTLESGLALTVTEGGSLGSNGLPGGTNRPDVVGKLSYPQTVGQWFNISIFRDPAVGQWGNAGKGILRGPGRDNWNLSIFKDFNFNESGTRRLEFRAETFNTLNHTQYNNVVTTKTASNFGAITSAWPARDFQFALKLMF